MLLVGTDAGGKLSRQGVYTRGIHGLYRALRTPCLAIAFLCLRQK